MTLNKKRLYCKIWLQSCFDRDNNNTIIETYNELFDSNLPNNSTGIEIVIKDKRFISHLIKDETFVENMKKDLSEWYSWE